MLAEIALHILSMQFFLHIGLSVPQMFGRRETQISGTRGREIRKHLDVDLKCGQDISYRRRDQNIDVVFGDFNLV